MNFKRIMVLTAVLAATTTGAGVAQARDAQPGLPSLAPDRVEAAQATAEQIAQEPACTRKVKVVYSGYGESARAPCGATPPGH